MQLPAAKNEGASGTNGTADVEADTEEVAVVNEEAINMTVTWWDDPK